MRPALCIASRVRAAAAYVRYRRAQRFLRFRRQSAHLFGANFALAAGLDGADLFADFAELPFANALPYVIPERRKTVQRYLGLHCGSEDGANAIVIFLRNRVELVIVTAGASGR